MPLKMSNEKALASDWKEELKEEAKENDKPESDLKKESKDRPEFDSERIIRDEHRVSIEESSEIAEISEEGALTVQNITEREVFLDEEEIECDFPLCCSCS
jgi:hypothetical protein